jgi:hypothetical protein
MSEEIPPDSWCHNPNPPSPAKRGYGNSPSSPSSRPFAKPLIHLEYIRYSTTSTTMAQRVTLRKRQPYNTTSNRRRVVKTPGGKLVVHHLKKKAVSVVLW